MFKLLVAEDENMIRNKILNSIDWNKLKEEIIREQNERVEIESLRQQLRENKKALQDKFFVDLISNNFIGNIENNLKYLNLELISDEDEEKKYIFSKQLHILVDSKLYDHLKVGAFEEIKKDIESILSEIKNSRLGVDAINTIINNIILLSCKTISEIGYNVFDIFGNDFTPNFDIKGINALVQLEEGFFNFFRSINDYINQKRSNRNELLLTKVKEYIDNNYAENITLAALSKMFNKNPSYLSLLFNEYIGQNFIDYLSNLRIQKAKELLKNSNLHVYEISEKVGYRDSYYFSSAFKRIVGINPTEYREKSW